MINPTDIGAQANSRWVFSFIQCTYDQTMPNCSQTQMSWSGEIPR